MEKALIVRIDAMKTSRKAKQASDEALAELNEHLASGWRIKEISQTSGTKSYYSFSIAVLTKDA